MIDWTDAAIEAAFDEAMECFDDAMMENHQQQIKTAMRAALNAAVKAQRIDNFDYRMGVLDGALAALEEAAKVAEDMDDVERGDEIYPPSQFDIATAIRALKDT